MLRRLWGAWSDFCTAPPNSAIGHHEHSAARVMMYFIFKMHDLLHLLGLPVFVTGVGENNSNRGSPRFVST